MTAALQGFLLKVLPKPSTHQYEEGGNSAALTTLSEPTSSSFTVGFRFCFPSPEVADGSNNITLCLVHDFTIIRKNCLSPRAAQAFDKLLVHLYEIIKESHYPRKAVSCGGEDTPRHVVRQT